MCRPTGSRLSRVASLLVQSFSTSSSSAVGGNTYSSLFGRLPRNCWAHQRQRTSLIKTTSFQDMGHGERGCREFLDIRWGASREVFAPAKSLPRLLATGDLLTSPRSCE